MNIYIDHDYNRLPASNDSTISVQIYNRDGVVAKNGIKPRDDVATIGKPVYDAIKRLGFQISDEVMDFLTISMAVTAADTFIVRDDCFDGWTRDINVSVRVINPSIWIKNKENIEKALQFLSGDVWSFDFKKDGMKPPVPFKAVNGRRLINLDGLDCISLFSGGLDSAIGVIDLLTDGKKPLLISHSYKGDKAKQEKIAEGIKSIGSFSRLCTSANPIGRGMQRDITMRTRSLNFLAFSAVGADAVMKANDYSNISIYVPENGFISLNAPLTNRRIGSLSTRTTHPHFMEMIQSIFDDIGIKMNFTNPYQFETKGKMVSQCKDKNTLAQVVDSTVSCSHWKRKHKQCGYCVPCMIRRASLLRGGIQETITYHQASYANLRNFVKNKKDGRDDIFSVMMAIENAKKRNLKAWVLKSGKLKEQDVSKYENVFFEGLQEVEAFLKKEKLV
ncbi:DNA-binding protein [Pectobacterium brasiliense]|uniref:Qat anti-phage system QueC-like protein QatC n=1 Tax=Pectobacterium brasiliense TaxID=180957 RepID=UPI00057EAC17|nr:Qat anti-phage system QueC-like protein QatC [Pectobacterium brasiliense]KHS73937.1 DNA-binding protein [Pectobacterium brasiliense]KHS87749.1 DNA-binding protein [Pectobacterium brasiliense]